MSDADDVMLVPRLPEAVDVALLPISSDADPAAWLPLVRAAVRRTRKQLFILFKGTLGISCNSP